MLLTIRFIFISVLIVFTSTAWALSASKKPDFNGFYVGISGGMDTWTVNPGYTLYAPSYENALFATSLKNDEGTNGGSGGLFLGWGFSENPWYSSIELNLDYMSNKHTFAVNGVTFSSHIASVNSLDQITEQQQWSAGLDGRFGYIFNYYALLYLRAGYGYEAFKSEAIATITDIKATYTETSRINSFRVGVGSEFCLDRNWRIRTEFWSNIYRNIPYFIGNIPGIEQFTDGGYLSAGRTYTAFYLGILRQF